MKKHVSIVEIPTAQFSRAVSFYKAILDIEIEEIEMDGVKMGLFPNDGGDIFVQLIHGSDYKPASEGVVVYLYGGDDLEQVVRKIESNGGRVIQGKTEIPEMGFYAFFIDTEGNRLGLYSSN
jgi:predicted enzyme related to lactoylglutathione lyase